MAKAQDVTVNIRTTLSCSISDHCFVKFDATRIYCTRCGEFRTAPTTYTYFPQWKWDWTPTVSPTITWGTGTTTTFKSDCTSL